MANLSNINNKFLVTTGGNVGINSTGPNEKLEVGGSIRIDNGASFTSYQVYRDNIKYGDVGGGGNQFTIQASNNKNINLFDDSGVGLTVKDGGNVGIGTTSPGEKLAVEGDASYIEITHPTATSYSGIKFSEGGTPQGSIQNIGSTFATVARRGNFEIFHNTGGDLTLQHSGGNVGIGTTSPSSKLEIAAANSQVRLTDTDDSKFVLYSYSGGKLIVRNNSVNTTTNQFTLTEDGKFGIGTISPVANLEVASTAPVIRITNTTDPLGNGTVGSFEFFTNDSSTGAARTVSSIVCDNQAGSAVPEGQLVFKTSLGGGGSPVATEKMRIFSNGNVNIGVAETGSSAVTGPFVVTHTSSRFLTSSYEESSVSLSAKNNNNNLETLRLAGDSIKFFNGTNAVGSQKMVILNSGNVGINTTSPSQKLHVVGDQLIFGDLLLEGSANSFRTVSMNTSDGSDNQTLSLCGGATASSARGGRVEIKGNEADGSVILVAGNISTGDIDFYTANTQRMIINNAGNVGIGTTSPGQKLEVYQAATNSQAYVTVQNNRSRNAAVLTQTTNGGFYTGTSIGTDTLCWQVYDASAGERMRITSGGNLDFNSHSGAIIGYGFRLTSASDYSQIYMEATTTTSRIIQRYYNPNGNVGNITISGSSTTYGTSSDYRLKEDLQDFNGLDKVSKIPVYNFKWKTDESRSYGVMAHELQGVLPDAVTGEKDAEEMQGVDYSKIVPLLIKAIQELKAEIELLKSK